MHVGHPHRKDTEDAPASPFGGDGRQILESIHSQLMGLPGETEVFPGHGDPTTIAREKRSNYFLQGL